MPGKSRSKKERRVFKPVAVQEQTVNPVKEAITVNVGQAPSAAKPASSVPLSPSSTVAKTAAAVSTYIGRELLTITLMTGAMLVVVIIVSILFR